MNSYTTYFYIERLKCDEVLIIIIAQSLEVECTVIPI